MTHGGGHLGELSDGPVDLPVQDPPVRDDDDGVEGVFSFVFHADELPGHPGYGVGLAAAGRMLDQVSLAGALGPDVCQDFPHHVQLVVPWPYLAVVGLLGIVLENVSEAVGSEDLLPQVCCFHTVGVDRVAGPAVVSAPVERQEVGCLALQLGAEPRLLVVQREVDGAPAEPEKVFLCASAGLVLLYGVGDGLSGEPVLQLHGGYGKAVHEQHDVQGQVLVVAICSAAAALLRNGSAGSVFRPGCCQGLEPHEGHFSYEYLPCSV